MPGFAVKHEFFRHGQLWQTQIKSGFPSHGSMHALPSSGLTRSEVSLLVRRAVLSALPVMILKSIVEFFQ
jgi:hypothetical protein